MSADSPPSPCSCIPFARGGQGLRGGAERLGDIGFVGVELAGFHDLTPKQYAAIVEESGLVTSSAHLNDLSPDGLNAMLDDLQEIGCDVAVCAFMPPERFADLDAIEASADALNKANDIARSRGVSLGYHNHWWEFSTTLDGQTAWSALIDRLDATVFAESTSTGRRSVAQIHGRSSPISASDCGCSTSRTGRATRRRVRWSRRSGTLDIPAILASAPTAKWHIVELDRCATDMFTALADSYRYLVDSGQSPGRV